MANNWRYYQQTGQAGGTTTLQYVDSFNGDDANSGAYNAPKQTIQGALDVASGSFPIIVCAGYFNEGDFLNRRSNLSIITEGYVKIDGVGFSSFNPNTASVFINENYNFGTLEISNFTTALLSSGSTASLGYVSFCVFKNVLSVNLGTTASTVLRLLMCVFIDSPVSCTNNGGTTPREVQNNTFINSNVTFSLNSVSEILLFRNNYANASTKVNLGTRNYGDSLIWNNNLIAGTDGGGQKIRINSVWYANTEALQSATSYGSNDLASTTDPLFNLINPFDLTLDAASTLARAGYGKIYIGAYGVAKSTESDNVVWTPTGIDNTTTPGEAVLTASPTGTLVSSLIQVTDKVRRITRINMPDFEIAPSLGETIGRLASDRTPYTVSVEIQYSINGSTTNGTWLRVPIGTQPLHDTVNNVGNDDSTFDIVNSVEIFASHIQYRVTMRDNETPI